ncbi:putative metal homeostasis protein [Companilactobacillus mishanensis]|nr:putative metal homeostasis protein [Companilactobacillus mishanensis]
MNEKIDLASARRRLQSANIKTRKRALKIIKEAKRNPSRVSKLKRA